METEENETPKPVLGITSSNPCCGYESKSILVSIRIRDSRNKLAGVKLSFSPTRITAYMIKIGYLVYIFPILLKKTLCDNSDCPKP